MISENVISSSFRDPSGFLFTLNNQIFRQVNKKYKDNYDQLISSGLYDILVEKELLIPHQEVDQKPADAEKVYKIIKPEIIHFISYPYEWCFSQLKDAALITLSIQKKALEYEMSLKDCSAYNIQFRDGKPILIDTLSFEKYKEGEPWIAYRQFCQHFLGPLALMSYKDIRLIQLFRIYIDGLPLDLTSSLLPKRSYLKFSILSHIHLHAKSQEHYADKSVKTRERKMSRQSLKGIVDNLELAIKKLTWQPDMTEWGDYYEETNYSKAAFKHKKELVSEFIELVKPKAVWDLGANTGVFSRMSSQKEIKTISFDIDPVAVEKNYLQSVKNGENNILPLVLDLTNPSPSIGWQNEERMSLIERGPVDTVLALALIHHLAISNNLPFDNIAVFFHNICQKLIIEFVPKSDSQVQRLLTTREDIFSNYQQDVFESEFKKHFKILNSVKINDSERTIYLMQRR